MYQPKRIVNKSKTVIDSRKIDLQKLNQLDSDIRKQ